MNTLSSRRNHHALRLLGAGLFVVLTGGVMPSADAAPADGPAGHRHGGAMMSGLGGGVMAGLHSQRVLDAVDASPEQRTQIRQIMDTARTDLKAQREAGRGLHDQARQLFTQPTVDAHAAEVLRKQMMAQHDLASQRMMQALLEVSRVLSPEQRAKLAELAGQRRAMMERRHAPK